ncbi:MAG: hypothetical protein IT355_09120 [Gemmatimonadaceae bacterium]|nr:hypothetical protein [Gemmatimonadaceae bacterium]
MSSSPSQSPLARRSFMARLAAGIAAFSGTTAVAAAAAPSAGPWQPTRHPQDDWLDEIPGQHRFFFDALTPLGAGEALQFTTNFLVASRAGYQLADADNAVVICLRHWATPLAFSDAMWAKYGAVFSERSRFLDPKTSAAPTINVYLTKGYGLALPNREHTFTDAIGRRVQFAVCEMALRAYATMIAQAHTLPLERVVAELRASAHAGSHFVPAGIVAVNRAQERGYTIQHIG